MWIGIEARLHNWFRTARVEQKVRRPAEDDLFKDESGQPYAMKYNGTVYYYITNLQGDVMHIVNASGTVVASYDYDPYGKVISAAGTLANINPLRYRGYMYDQETGFY